MNDETTEKKTELPYRHPATVPGTTSAAAPVGELSLEARRERALANRQKADQEREHQKRVAEVERLELAERLEKEHGLEGQGFAIYDATDIGAGLFAVKLGEAVLYTTFMESKITPTDRYDFVAPCIVHPSRAEYDAAQHKRPGINVELSNRLGALYGLEMKGKSGK